MQGTCRCVAQGSQTGKGRTIKKLMGGGGGGGGGRSTKKYSRKGKLNEEKFMHAN